MSEPAKSSLDTAFFPGAFLTRTDYIQSQSYQIAQRRVLTAALNSEGIIDGLQLSLSEAGLICVSPGSAYTAGGDLIFTQEALRAPKPPQTGNWALDIANIQTPIPADGPDRVGATAYRPTLTWRSLSQQLHPLSGSICLGGYQGDALTSDGRIYALARTGSLNLIAAKGVEPATISSWGAASACGLEFRAQMLSVQALPGIHSGMNAVSVTDMGARLHIADGLGVGRMSPQAMVDVETPISRKPGPGELTSFQDTIMIDSPLADTELATGFTIFITDENGVTSSTVLGPQLDSGSWRVDPPINAKNQAYTYQRSLSLRLTNVEQSVGLSVTRSGQVGWGTDQPKARMDVADGDLMIAGSTPSLTFQGDGQVESASLGVIDLSASTNCLSIIAPSAMSWATDQTQCVTMNVTGDLGIGVSSPQCKLDVDGYIHARETGFVFPDGSVQKSAEISVPLGAVIDWWRSDVGVSIPPQYRICDGEVIHGGNPVFDNKRTPNLTHLFSKGVTDPAQAGETQAASNQHLHTFNTPAHTHQFPHVHPNLEDLVTGGASHSEGMAGATEDNARSGHTHTFSGTVDATDTVYTGANNTQGEPGTTDTAEPLPPYFGLVKLMRVI